MAALLPSECSTRTAILADALAALRLPERLESRVHRPELCAEGGDLAAPFVRYPGKPVRVELKPVTS